MLVDELPRRSLGHDLGLVHDHEVVAQLLGLVHVVGRDDERRAAALELIEALPQQVARLGVQAGRRLVEDDEVRLVDERAGDRQAPLHAAGQGLDLVLGALVELDELEELIGPLARDLAGDVEVARVHLQVLAHRELGVEVVDLRHDAEARLDLAGLRARIHPEHAQLTLGHRARARDHPHRRGLARAIRSEEAERLARTHVEVDAVDRDEAVREALGQAARMDERGLAAHGDRHSRPMRSSVLIGLRPWRPVLTGSVRLPISEWFPFTYRSPSP